jgi:hypothetical protein
MREWSAVLHAVLEAVLQPHTTIIMSNRGSSVKYPESRVCLPPDLIYSSSTAFFLFMCLSCKCQYLNATVETHKYCEVLIMALSLDGCPH